MIFFILAFILSAYGSVSQNGKAKLIQGLPFSFYTYAETPPGQIAHGPAVFIPSAFLLDVVTWYLMAYLLIRFYDTCTGFCQQSIAFWIRLLASVTVLIVAPASTVVKAPSW